ncbi:MAG: polysaccharide deacetylase family protein [Cyclobacteriaceae bacterium]|nr:polysaccharide deacetylase family protein [Cyclobacteriaceae bacterium]
MFKPQTCYLLLCLFRLLPGAEAQHLQFDHGAIIRGDTSEKKINLVFTGHEFADGSSHIITTLKKNNVPASFFFTGDFYRNSQFKGLIKQLIRHGHYLGAHADKHLLYCSWEKRDSLLVTRQEFLTDLDNNYREMARFGIEKSKAKWFMPPYEWYNDAISQWTLDYGATLINFSPGTSSNADYTYPQMGERYLDSQTIFQRIMNYEQAHTLNGFILLIHIGTDPRRKDKFYYRLDELINTLTAKGYTFVSLENLLAN